MLRGPVPLLGSCSAALQACHTLPPTHYTCKASAVAPQLGPVHSSDKMGVTQSAVSSLPRPFLTSHSSEFIWMRDDLAKHSWNVTGLINNMGYHGLHPSNHQTLQLAGELGCSPHVATQVRVARPSLALQ